MIFYSLAGPPSGTLLFWFRFLAQSRAKDEGRLAIRRPRGVSDIARSGRSQGLFYAGLLLTCKGFSLSPYLLEPLGPNAWIPV